MALAPPTSTAITPTITMQPKPQNNRDPTSNPQKPAATYVTQRLHNQERLIKAMSHAQATLSKFHNLSFPTSESWLIHTVRSICETPVTLLTPHGFKFNMLIVNSRAFFEYQLCLIGITHTIFTLVTIDIRAVAEIPRPNFFVVVVVFFNG